MSSTPNILGGVGDSHIASKGQGTLQMLLGQRYR